MGTLFVRGRYYSRVIVPVDLRPLIGRVEIRKSLRTVAYRDAKLLAGKWEGRLAELFSRLRQGGAVMTLEQIKKLVQAYIDSALEESEQSWLSSKGLDDGEAYSLAITDRLEETAEHLQRNDFKRVSAEVDELLKTHRRTLPKSSEAYRRLCREVLKARQYVLKRELDRLDGVYLNEFEQAPARESVPQPETVRLISEALKDYFKHYAHRGEGTNFQKERVLQRFLESVGDKPIQEVTKADCLSFRDQYSRMPKRISNEVRKAPLGVILKAMGKKAYVAVGKGTVNYALIDVSHFFSWAIKNDFYLGKNPVGGIAYEGTKQEHYAIFSEADLRAIFQSPMFTSQREGNHPERYWLIVMLALTGARREEIAQLRVADVKLSEGVWFFDITGQDGKTLKNTHSRRRVPIHSRLLSLGLLDYVNARQGPMLFPMPTKAGGRPTHGDAVSKWLARLKEQVGVMGRKPLHSFRHTAITRLVSAGVPQDIREVLVGHASASVHGSVYTHREEISLTLLQGHLEKLTLPI